MFLAERSFDGHRRRARALSGGPSGKHASHGQPTLRNHNGLRGNTHCSRAGNNRFQEGVWTMQDKGIRMEDRRYGAKCYLRWGQCNSCSIALVDPGPRVRTTSIGVHVMCRWDEDVRALFQCPEVHGCSRDEVRGRVKGVTIRVELPRSAASTFQSPRLSRCW